MFFLSILIDSPYHLSIDQSLNQKSIEYDKSQMHEFVAQNSIITIIVLYQNISLASSKTLIIDL